MTERETTTAEEHETGAEESGPPPGFFEVALSVMAAALGVQNAKNKERDFSRGNPIAFIVGGLLFTILFVLTLITVVMLIV